MDKTCETCVYSHLELSTYPCNSCEVIEGLFTKWKENTIKT